ncbi:hypothetical protein [Spirochaeta lutea]|uniref:Uncharacterized protein n=1 Tax=Spirochaeta lutea TaxID=1480694 RepID=A0A098QUY7_9SPIO|nr:hypothetical protein [Spirochaeta lutea]KGE71670.1 hypothetical protein DC28_10425 [Spirochaeta lutea]
MQLMILEINDIDYKEDVFLALQSVGINQASCLSGENLDKSLESEFSLFTGFFRDRGERAGEQLLVLARIPGVETAKELIANLRLTDIPFEKEHIISLSVIPLSLSFSLSEGLIE